MFPSVSPDGRRVAPVLVLSKLAIHRGGPAVESRGLFPIYRARAVYEHRIFFFQRTHIMDSWWTMKRYSLNLTKCIKQFFSRITDSTFKVDFSLHLFRDKNMLVFLQQCPVPHVHIFSHL